MTEPTKHAKVRLYHDYAGMVDCETGERVTCAPMTYVGFADYEALQRELTEARGEIKRLIEANEHWHIRVEQLKRDLEAALGEREEARAALHKFIHESLPKEVDEAYERAAQEIEQSDGWDMHPKDYAKLVRALKSQPTPQAGEE